MVLAVLASIVVSVDDYCACARLTGVSLPPEHAVNRGTWTLYKSDILTSLYYHCTVAVRGQKGCRMLLV